MNAILLFRLRSLRMRLGAVALVAAFGSIGCGHLPLLTSATTAVGWKRAAAAPTEMAILASPMPLQDDKNNILQGVFCRIYFFTRDNPSPVPVAGEMTITLDNSPPKPDAPAVEKSADKPFPKPGLTPATFHIPADRLAKHVRTDVVGVCYAFWFPCQPTEPTDVLLRASLNPKDAKSFSSDPIRVRIEPPAPPTPEKR